LYWSVGLSLISNIPKRPNWPVKTHLFINSGRLDNIDKCLSFFAIRLPSYAELIFFAAKSLITNVQECVTRPSISAGVGLVYRFDPVRVEVNFGVPLVASKSDGHKRGFEVGVGVNFL
jgi:outer membrane protein insertion porin family